jgi:Family of unknown function (DUF6498)
MATATAVDNWMSAWPDVVAFGIGLAVARWAGWSSGDLIWSLWLSSLVVGYSSILWMIGQPTFALLRESWRDRALAREIPKALPVLWAVVCVAALFFLAFFTVHFGMFHYIHSQFLMFFFPITTGAGTVPRGGTNIAVYTEVLRRYWVFLPSAFLSHRAVFLRKPLSFGREMSVASLRANKVGGLMTEPYRNVIRLHMLIFFFFFAHFLHLENFAVYAVVYAVYFFPWNLLQRETPAAAPVPIR